jgi:hypothetical protein
LDTVDGWRAPGSRLFSTPPRKKIAHSEISKRLKERSEAAMAASQVQRLVDRVQKSSDGRSPVKSRTLLTAFGYGRRTPDVIKDIRQQLSAAGVAVELSVSLPASLDERVILVLASAPRASSEPAAAGVDRTAMPVPDDRAPAGAAILDQSPNDDVGEVQGVAVQVVLA